MKGYLQQKIYKPLINHLANGVSPSRMALTISLGIVCGICPMLWMPTLLCVSFAMGLRLSFPVMQISNYLTYPLHVVCIIPFYKTGAYFFNETFDLSIKQFIEMAENGVFAMIEKIGMSIVHAIAAWAILAPALVGMLYIILLPLVTRVAMRLKTKTVIVTKLETEPMLAKAA